MRWPSQTLPEVLPKKLIPLRGSTAVVVAYSAPVSELESPKLYIVGCTHFWVTCHTQIEKAKWVN